MEPTPPPKIARMLSHQMGSCHAPPITCFMIAQRIAPSRRNVPRTTTLRANSDNPLARTSLIPGSSGSSSEHPLRHQSSARFRTARPSGRSEDRARSTKKAKAGENLKRRASFSRPPSGPSNRCRSLICSSPCIHVQQLCNKPRPTGGSIHRKLHEALAISGEKKVSPIRQA